MDVIPTLRSLIKPVSSLLLIIMGLTSCHPHSCLLEPTLCYVPNARAIKQLPSPFDPLTIEEKETLWGSELFVGKQFAKEFDFYRAITAFKRSSFLVPSDELPRVQEIDYDLFLSYYLAGKMQNSVEVFEYSSLGMLNELSPAYNTVAFLLQDAYYQSQATTKADVLLEVLKRRLPETALKLQIYHAVSEGNLAQFQSLDSQSSDSINFLTCYQSQVKSVKKAQRLNAFLPGAGYYYVGQKKSALTSLLLNVLTTAAAVHFYREDNWGACLLFASAEFGWYVGGINGAGLAAKEYNETLYNNLAKNYLISTRSFPVLMLSKGF